MRRYKTEPYALCGDVYSVGKNAGRGGWSFYTGAAGWLYKAGIEFILGIKKENNLLHIRPCTTLKEYTVEYRYGTTPYTLHITLGDANKNTTVELVDDGKRHEVEVAFNSIHPDGKAKYA